MKDYLSKARVISFIVFLLEIVGVVTVFLFYYYNLYNAQEIFTPISLVYGLIGLVAFNAIWLILVFLKINRIKYLNDLRVQDLFGSNVNSSFEFSSLGIVVVNEENEVIWVNDQMVKNNLNLLDQVIFDVFPPLTAFIDNTDDKEISVEAKGRYYNVTFLPLANVYFFKDMTDYVQLQRYSNDHSVVLGIIMIDNYDYLKDEYDEVSDVMTEVRSEILKYFKKYGVFLRKYSNDSYYAVCNRNSLNQIEENNFGILDDVKKLSKNSLFIPTLSIGFAYDFDQVLKLNDMASEAIEIAVSRGGDQAVVSAYGKELEFYGGKTGSVENKNKVVVRSTATGLINLIKGYTNIYIMGHRNTDLDSIGSCFGVLAICERIKLDNKEVKAKIVWDNKLADRNSRLAVQSLFSRTEAAELFVTPREAETRFNSKSLLIMCDHHRPSLAMSKELVDAADKIIVIDHHRRSDEFVENSIFTYIDPSASSASELVSELIKFSGLNPAITIPPRYATLMLSGIFLDTNFYKSPTCGERTFDASAFLKSFGADNLKADEFLKDDYEEHLLISKIISSMKTPYTGIVYCVADQETPINSDTLSKAANQCRDMKGVNASFVIGKTGEKEIKISARSDGTINCQLILESLGGGGHFTMAAVTIAEKSVSVVEQMLLNALRDRLDESRDLSKKKEDN